MTVLLVPSRVPLVDPGTGIVSREWYLFFQNFFTTTGEMGEAATLIEFLSTAPGEAASDELVTLSRSLADALLAPVVSDPVKSPDDLSAEIGSLRDEVAMLRRRIDELSQGSIVL